jgi:hypothetical protein
MAWLPMNNFLKKMKYQSFEKEKEMFAFFSLNGPLI